MFKPVAVFLFFLIPVILSAQKAGYEDFFSKRGAEQLSTRQLAVLQKEYLDKLYMGSVTVPNELINGREYFPYFYRSGTNPLLFADKSRTSTLFFRDMKFSNISLNYDTFLDVLVFTDNSKLVNGHYPQIALNNDNIRGFNLYFGYDSLSFKYLRFNGEKGSRMKDGFYELAYDGKIKFLIKHKSTVYNKEGLDKYAYSPDKYIMYGDSYFRITSNHSLQKGLGERSKEMAQLMKKKGVNIRKATKDQISDLLKTFDESVEKSNQKE